MKTISLTHGMIANVDDEDFDYISKFRWHVHKDGNRFYARTTVIENGKSVKKLMHRMVSSPNKTEVCDHKDGNGLNNVRDNIRNCSRSQNGCNVKPKLGLSSKFKGVHFHTATNKWVSRITIEKKCLYLGLFESEISAAMAYNIKAKELHGEFAKLNTL